MQDRAVEARKAHNLEVGGSNPSPASRWETTYDIIFKATSTV